MSNDNDRLKVLNLEKPLSKEQESAILEKGNILVSASAGSGKTFTMINKILLALCEGVKLKDIIILVYNESVASELKEKIHDSLYKLISEKEGELKQKLLDDLDALPICNISTIHSFCRTLLKENFDKVGVSPAFKILDEKEHKEYQEKAISSVLSKYYKTTDDYVFDQVVEIFSRGRKDDNLKDNIFKLYSLMDIQPDKTEFIKNVNECFNTDVDKNKYSIMLFEYYKNMLIEYENKLEEFSINPYIKDNEKFSARIANDIDIFKSIISSNNLNEMLAKIPTTLENLTQNNIKNINSKEYCYIETVRSYISEYKALLNKILGEFNNPFVFNGGVLEQNKEFIDKLIEIVLAFDEELKKIKLNDNVFSFDDLLHYAADLLKNYPDLANEYQAIFVDEYQDVNPIQEVIINQLIKGTESSFLVGDVKQSIYAFRLADPQIFLDRKNLYDHNDNLGTAINFNANFRSHKCILDFVNEVFSSSMRMKNADIDYERDSQFNITSANPEGGKVSIHFFKDKTLETSKKEGIYDIRNHQEEESKIKGEVLEGKFIAREIKTLVNHEIIELKSGEERLIEFGDIVLLFRSRNATSQRIVQTIKSQGVPLDESTFLEKESMPERELMNFLRIIDNPMQDIPLAGYLLSYFGGYSEDELYQISNINEGINLYDNFIACSKSDTELGNKAKETLNIIQKYRIKASFKNVSELMEGIVSDYSYDAYLMRQGEDSVNGIKKFINSSSSKDEISLGKFLDTYIEEKPNDSNSSNKGFVHVSTFHAYKGLESPVVFVCNAGDSFNNQDSKNDLIEKGNGYIGIKYFDFDARKKYKSLSFLGIENYCKQQSVKEEMRLFYVALTRAKKYLYITSQVKKEYEKEFGKEPLIKGFENPLDFISLAKFEGKLSIEEKYHNAEEFDEISTAPSKVDYKIGEQKIIDSIKKESAYEYQNKKASKLQIKYSVTALDSIDEPIISVYEEATKTGILYHKVMQHINLNNESIADIKNDLEYLVAERILTEEEKDRIDLNIILKCLQSEVMCKARDAYHCYREKRFMMYKPAKDILDDLEQFEGVDDKVLVQGVVDLYVEGEQNIIVDFKYAKLSDEKILKKYEKQLKLYKNAIESTNSVKIDRIILYSFIEGKQHEIEI